MKKISAVIAAAGLGTRLKDYKDNSHTKVLIKIRQSSMISEQISQLSALVSYSFYHFFDNPKNHS